MTKFDNDVRAVLDHIDQPLRQQAYKGDGAALRIIFGHLNRGECGSLHVYTQEWLGQRIGRAQSTVGGWLRGGGTAATTNLFFLLLPRPPPVPLPNVDEQADSETDEDDPAPNDNVEAVARDLQALAVASPHDTQVGDENDEDEEAWLKIEEELSGHLEKSGEQLRKLCVSADLVAPADAHTFSDKQLHALCQEALVDLGAVEEPPGNVDRTVDSVLAELRECVTGLELAFIPGEDFVEPRARCVGELGRGAFGVVNEYSVHRALFAGPIGKQPDAPDETLQVACKTLPPFTPKNQEHFRRVVREVSVWAAANTTLPSAPRLLGVCAGRAAGGTVSVIFVSQCIEGETLRTVLSDMPAGGRGAAFAITLARDLAMSLASFHQGGDFAHRDIKPENIMVSKVAAPKVAAPKVAAPKVAAPKVAAPVDTKADADGGNVTPHVHIIDFGAGTMEARGADTMVGTVSYMAPEVGNPDMIDNDTYTASHSDVWSLGVVLFEIAAASCGQGTYTSRQTAAKVHGAANTGGQFGRWLEDEIATRGFGAKWAKVIESCLKLKHDDRGTAAEVADLLKKMMNEESAYEAALSGIFTYAQRRVALSETIYVVGNRRRFLGNWGRVTHAIDHLKEDCDNCLEKPQVVALHEMIATGGFITALDDDAKFRKICRSDLTDPTNCNVIYIMQRKKDGMGYIGKTNRKFQARINQHFCGVKTIADRAMNQDRANKEAWRTGQLCTYSTSAQMDRLEVLMILLFNTSLARRQSMGFNMELGGQWGATRFM
jgi:serine/threonine protein kinase